MTRTFLCGERAHLSPFFLVQYLLLSFLHLQDLMMNGLPFG
jgi:hypothetical protein